MILTKIVITNLAKITKIVIYVLEQISDLEICLQKAFFFSRFRITKVVAFKCSIPDSVGANHNFLKFRAITKGVQIRIGQHWLLREAW